MRRCTKQKTQVLTCVFCFCTSLGAEPAGFARAGSARDAQPRGPLQGFRLIPLFLHRIPAVFVLPHIGAEPERFALNFFKMVAIICIFEYNRTIEFRGTTILQAKIGRGFPLRHAAILIPPKKRNKEQWRRQ